MPILFRLLQNLLFGVWCKLNKQSVGTRETPTLSQTDLKQTRLPGCVAVNTQFPLNLTGKRQQPRKDLVYVSKREPPHESATVYLSRRGVNKSGGRTSDYIAKLKTFLVHDIAEEH